MLIKFITVASTGLFSDNSEIFIICKTILVVGKNLSA
jgi:hypothetical protein